MNDQNYRGSSRPNQYEGRNQNDGRGSSWQGRDESSRSERGADARERSSSRDDRNQNWQGSAERWGRSGNDDQGYSADRGNDEDSRDNFGGRDYGRNRSGYRDDSSGFGAQGRYGNWDTSSDRDAVGSQSPYGSSARPGSGSGARFGYGSSGAGQYGGSGSYGQGSYGQGSYGQGSYGQGSYGQGSYGQGSYGQGSSDASSYGSGVYRANSVSHTGRGPKGYTRSDERIREDVCERLSQNDEVDASEIEVEVKDRRVTLTGSVENRRMKHLAEDIAEAVSGVDDVDNRVSVRKTFLRDIADRVTGNEGEQHHANSGTKNNLTPGTSSTGTGVAQTASR